MDSESDSSDSSFLDISSLASVLLFLLKNLLKLLLPVQGILLEHVFKQLLYLIGMSYTLKLLLRQIYLKLRYIVFEKRQYLEVWILQFLEL
jgi:hypothetical protein